MYANLGIRVNAVAPGPVLTNIQASFDSELGEERVGGLLGSIPTPATAAQLASSITYLLSDDATNITGVILASDGGWSAQ
jgi:NAD(P)-dependent dehydrogenase (short-subunit alcohol dehydrogenase family)